MGSPAQYCYLKLHEFFEIYPLDTIREEIADNKEHIHSKLDMEARYFFEGNNYPEHEREQSKKISGIFDKAVSGYNANVCKDIVTYSRVAYQAYKYLNETAKSLPEPDYFVKRTKVCLEKGFNPNVKLDQFLQEFDRAIKAMWDMENRLEDAGITHIGGLVSHTEEHVFSAYYPEIYEDSKPLVCTIMNIMMQNKGIGFDLWNRGGNIRLPKPTMQH